ncbi:MAG: hypothetical protein GY787_30420 [Alteromonadales bacterium]|nr:hypothetical protein [Alteromonadales bacterium]
MEFFKRHPKIAKVLMLLVLIAIFPFDGVFLVIADVAGVEASFALLVVMFHPVISWVSSRAFYIKLTLQAIKHSFRSHKLNKAPVYFTHALACSFVFVFTSSVLFAGCIWLPVLVMGGQVV